MWKTKGWGKFGKTIFGPLFLISAFSFLTSFSFAPYRLSYLAFFSLIPLFYFIQKAFQTREVWIYGFGAGLAFFLYHLQWLLVFGWLPWLGLAVYQAFFWGLAAYLIKKAQDRGWKWLSPFFWVGMEFFRSTGLTGFGWGILGISQTDSFLSLVYPYFGVWGASFLVVSFNLLFSWLFIRKKIKEVVFLAVAFLFAVTFFRFFSKLSVSRFSKGEENLRVVLVQTAVPQREKIAGKAKEKFLKTLSALEEKSLKRESLIVFPETAYPYPLFAGSEVWGRLQELAEKKKSWVLTGAFRESQGKTFNSAFLFSPGQKQIVYDKVHLVPFGEYWPFRPYLSWLPYASLIQEDLSSGSKLGLLPYKKSYLGVGICFESTDPLLAFNLVREGARVLVFITNDSWFDQTDALAQHFQIAQVRAAESRRPVLQVANTGYTGVISPEGRIIAQGPLNQPALLTKDLDYWLLDSFFISWGYLFPLFSFFLTVSFLLNQAHLFLRFRFSPHNS